MIIALGRTVTGLLFVSEILDGDIGMSLVPQTNRRAGKTVETIPQTRWLHPITRSEYRHRNGKLYELYEEERECEWTYANSSRQLLESL